MSYADDFNLVFAAILKEQPIVAAAEPISGLRRLEFLYIAIARCEVAVCTVKNVE